MNDTRNRDEQPALETVREVKIPAQYGPEVSLAERLRRVHEEMTRA